MRSRSRLGGRDDKCEEEVLKLTVKHTPPFGGGLLFLRKKMDLVAPIFEQETFAPCLKKEKICYD